MSRNLGLFEGYGIELEYMIVDKETLNVRPISDEVMKSVEGHYVSDVGDGPITWSNELVLHVIELKTSGPAPSLTELEKPFFKSIQRINGILDGMGARLMPTAMHPWMNPDFETKLWPHDNNEIYDSYNRIFDCRGHGWSNLQSMHINLPFNSDDQFAKLHTAIRFILPILPALTASSPVYESKVNGIKDNRLAFYQKNQKRIPSIAGSVIPEPVTSEAEYRDKILSRIYSDIAPHDPEELLRDDWLNSRGAITRFGRKTIEIRILDTQECPSADLALAHLVTATVQLLVQGELCSMEKQLQFPTEALKSIFDTVVKNAEEASLTNIDYLSALGIPNVPTQGLAAREVWRHLRDQCARSSLISREHTEIAEMLWTKGSLASRIQESLGPNPDQTKIKEVYKTLCNCLRDNTFYVPKEAR